MSRLLAAMKTDITIQLRNNLYTIGIAIAILSGVMVSQVVALPDFAVAIPILMLFVLGGSTLLYVAGLIIFEKDEGTIHALIVSPLRPVEYLWSKVITLTALAALESVVMMAVAFLIASRTQEMIGFNPLVLAIGIVIMGAGYTLLGIVMIVRYRSITDFLVPVLIVALILQAPFLYFAGLVKSPVFLLIPTSAPTYLMLGAFRDLEVWQWVYGLAYSTIQLLGLAWWASTAFRKHIIMKVG
jgi:fluoroquinolone transport system permease protein